MVLRQSTRPSPYRPYRWRWRSARVGPWASALLLAALGVALVFKRDCGLGFDLWPRDLPRNRRGSCSSWLLPRRRIAALWRWSLPTSLSGRRSVRDTRAMEKVVIADTKERALSEALDEIFTAFGGLQALIPSGTRIYVKPNAINFSPQAYTDPAVLDGAAGLLPRPRLHPPGGNGKRHRRQFLPAGFPRHRVYEDLQRNTARRRSTWTRVRPSR